MTAEQETDAILRLFGRMQDAWNRGDFAGYMAGFANPDVIFVSRGRIQKDWQATLDHYVRDYGGDAGRRGQLRFSDMTVVLLSPDHAQLVGRFTRSHAAGTETGINTRILNKRPGIGWVITLNHVSAIQ